MKEFAFIFRQVGRTLTEEQQKQRAEEVRNWAMHLRAEGHTMNPYLLGDEQDFVGPEGSAGAAKNGSTGDRVLAILLVDFASLDEAKRIAATHPVLKYGVSIEIRDATAPQFTPASAAAAR